MDRLRLSSRVSSLIWLLPLLTNFNNDIVSAIEGCPLLPLKSKTKPFQPMQSYPQGYMFFYACIEGYVRKAGTSSMTRCLKISGNHGSNLQWDNISGDTSLVCIPDPKRKKTAEGNSTQKTETDAIHNNTIPIGLGSGVGVILLIAVTVGGGLMLQRQCFSGWRSRDLPVPETEHVPLHPPEIHQPQQEQNRSSKV
ncbi:interleukin-15 receptor subunit alpha [Anguilla anguilla]|uniref:interleukin-15 receptor subunit alpha n=1 Tax=Anguilla anguilla TaxID=7936 RepID=UPI0015B2C456|nr:interleukin-15 receptor subunit alpha [Anguilla anguilla]